MNDQDRMTLLEYQMRAATTAVYPGQGTAIGLIYVALKGAGEAGEFPEKVGKAMRDDGIVSRYNQEEAIFQTKPLTEERRQALAHECGDILWYVALQAKELGFTLQEIAQMNLDKLAERKKKGKLHGSGDNR